MDKYNGKTNPHGGQGSPAECKRKKEHGGLNPDLAGRKMLEERWPVTSGGMAEHGEGLLEFMERTGD